jgi:AcrR family transcriptional regulator
MGRAPRADACRNRDRLLEVASAAFARDGVEASLERIAKDAGVGIGTLYRHFPNRDALMEAVYRHNLDQLIADAEELSANKPPVEALEEFMQRFVAYVATKKGLAMHLKTVLSADDELFTSSQERMNTTVTRLVAAAAASGGIRSDVDAGDLIRALAGVCMTSDMSVSQEQPCRISKLLMDGMRYGAPAASASA